MASGTAFERRWLDNMVNSTGLGRQLLLLVAAVMLLFAATGVCAEEKVATAPVPDKTHKCPVCGMVVHRYPDFIASVSFEDGHKVFFDGVKDMVKYIFNLGKYSPQRRKENIRNIFVTEYYDMRPVNGRKAHYVVGSDVYGPMGHELIPLASPEDARQFSKDHKGKRIVRFNEITPALIRQLD